MQERLGLSGLPLHCAALKANTSTCSPGFVLTQAEFLVDWAHWSGRQSLSAAVRVVNTNSMLRAMPQALEGPWGVQVMPWVLGSAGGEGALWGPSPRAELPPGARSQPGPSAAGNTGQGRESLGTKVRSTTFVFTGFVKTHHAPCSLGFTQAKCLQQWGFTSEGKVAPRGLHKASFPMLLFSAELHK